MARDFEVNTILRHLTKPIYCMRMGWTRWKPETKERWVRDLELACARTLNECQEWRARHHG